MLASTPAVALMTEIAVSAAQGADGLTDEVRIARRIDHVDTESLVIEMDHRRRDREVPLARFVVEIELTGPVVDGTDARTDAGLKQKKVGN